MYTFLITSFIYPVVVHWVWDTNGFLCAWGPNAIGRFTDGDGAEQVVGMIDFAGSGVVHMTGGVAAFVGAAVTGPRVGAFDGKGLPQQSVIFQTLGTLILWMGWYGFNGVSTLYIANYSGVAAHTMVTTTISAATGCLTCTLIGYLMDHTIDPSNANNGILAGLVGITSPCSTCSNFSAFVIGFSSAFVFYGSMKLMLKLKIDDVVNAAPVHGFCGAWGVICASLFASPHLYDMAYYSSRTELCKGLFYGGGTQFGANFFFMIVILLWVGGMSAILFLGMKFSIGVRVPEEIETAGMDSSKHGGMVDYAVGVAPAAPKAEAGAEA